MNDSNPTLGPDRERTRVRWPTWAGAIVVLGCLVTVAYTIVETFWG